MLDLGDEAWLAGPRPLLSKDARVVLAKGLKNLDLFIRDEILCPQNGTEKNLSMLLPHLEFIFWLIKGCILLKNVLLELVDEFWFGESLVDSRANLVS